MRLVQAAYIWPVLEKSCTFLACLKCTHTHTNTHLYSMIMFA